MGKRELSIVAQTSVCKKVDKLGKFLISKENKELERFTLSQRKRSKAMIVEDALIHYSFVKGKLSDFLTSEGLTEAEISDFLDALKNLYYQLIKDKF